MSTENKSGISFRWAAGIIAALVMSLLSLFGVELTGDQEADLEDGIADVIDRGDDGDSDGSGEGSGE